MRAALLVLLLVAGAALSFWLFRAGGDPTPQGAGRSDPVAATGAGAGQAPAGDQPPTADAPRAVPTRVEAAAEPPGELSDSPTACLLVVDYERGAPVAGASIRRMKGGAVIGFTDDRGIAPLPLKEREQLMTVADGYLLRMTPTRLGSTEQEPQRVQLVRDRWSKARRLEFRAARGGAVGDEVFLQIGELTDVPRGSEAAVGPAADDAVLSRAWSEHLMLASTAAAADVPVHGRSVVPVLRLVNGSVVRFTEPGDWPFEAATAGGLVARGVFRIPRVEAAQEQTVRVELAPGAFVSGTVRGEGDRPLAGATLLRQGADPLGLVCTTNAAGAFAFGPLPPGEVTLLVRHPDHEPRAFGPVAAGTADASVALQPLPKSTLRGRVRLRPGLAPIAGATVSWTAAQRPPLVARTEADGTFRIAATGETDGRLAVMASGCIVYEELVAPGAPFADYDVLPVATADRVAGGLTAVLAGVVVDASGVPQGGVAVRWQPRTEPAPAGVPGRRTLNGGSLSLPLVTTTREDGTFALETHRFGAGTLCLADREEGIETTAVAGTMRDDYRLRR